jgi:3-hydroxybutyryl-CoA dehydrogenase
VSVPARVGVLGGGRMGGGIAHAFLLAGAHVVVVDRPEVLDRARDGIRLSVERSLERHGASRPRDELLGALEVGADRRALADRELVIEAVPESAEVKAEALGGVEALLAPDAVLASNTSSLSIDGLAAGLRRPEWFLGLHFFNPVPASSLVEVVRGAATDPAIVAAAQAWVRDLGKAPVTVADAPGFASSRLGVALALEAIRMLEAGVASADDIDAAMTLGYRHQTGPLRTTDLVGLDVRLDIAEHLAAELGDRFEPPALLRRMVAEGRLGRKTGAGFFDWPDSEKGTR